MRQIGNEQVLLKTEYKKIYTHGGAERTIGAPTGADSLSRDDLRSFMVELTHILRRVNVTE
ncbi:hypothetical protein HanXRQr2_Chr04g0150381 [Helianthus annuus]|uniref:Uncharacterized protein n=1 Tax=Helianthus annuus TaxID=4232 RepID=A0A251TPV7_HELAN|nr:hypothetical protein HanXRQr2_Chr04g0150381 [Helianthus annuus]